MAVVVDILGHVVVENLVVRGCGIDPDTVSRIAGRCAVVRDVIGLQQVRLGAKQQNAATRVIRDVVLSHDDLRRGTAARETM